MNFGIYTQAKGEMGPAEYELIALDRQAEGLGSWKLR
jgi:hypothetical protein